MTPLLMLVLCAQVDAAPLPPPVDTPPLEGTVTAEPPPAPHHPWWDLGVTEATYRAILPEGPSDGTVTTEQRELFWKRYADLRRESFALDAAQLLLLAVPPVVALVGAAVVPLMGFGPFAAFTHFEGTGAQRLVRASYGLAPVAGLVAIGAAGIAGVVFSGLMAWDARDVGNPPYPVKVTKDARRAFAEAERGTWKHVVLAGGVAAVALAAGVGALVMPLLVPLVVAPLFGTTPGEVMSASVVELAGGGAVQLWSVLGGYAAMILIVSAIPAVAALMYLVQAMPAPGGPLDEDDEAEAAGDDRDISDLSPFKRRK